MPIAVDAAPRNPSVPSRRDVTDGDGATLACTVGRLEIGAGEHRGSVDGHHAGAPDQLAE